MVLWLSARTWPCLNYGQDYLYHADTNILGKLRFLVIADHLNQNLLTGMSQK